MSEFDLSSLISPEAHRFYAEHAHANISKLFFKYANDPLKKKWVEQLESRAKARKKLPSWSENPNVIYPPKRNLEQASSERTALHKASLVDYNSSLDLTAGTGVDSWAFSLRSKRHISTEPIIDLNNLNTHNYNALNLTNCSAVNSSSEAFLEQCNQTFDLIFIDPSRRSAGGRKVILLEDYSPNVIELKERLLEIGNIVMIKVSPMVDLRYIQETFAENLGAIHIVAVHNEVKEVLFLLQNNPADLSIHATNLHSGGNQSITFKPLEIDVPHVQANALKTFIYEPNAAVLKTGFFSSLCERFGLEKLDRHSHLYTAEREIDGFPGYGYRIIEHSAPFKLKTKIPSASIISRNFPQKPEAIRKRLKVKDGNAYRLFATTLNGKKIFILGEAIANN